MGETVVCHRWSQICGVQSSPVSISSSPSTSSFWTTWSSSPPFHTGPRPFCVKGNICSGMQTSLLLSTLPISLPSVSLSIALCRQLKPYLARTVPSDVADLTASLPDNVAKFAAQSISTIEQSITADHDHIVHWSVVDSCWPTLKPYVWAKDKMENGGWMTNSAQVALAFLCHGSEHELCESERTSLCISRAGALTYFISRLLHVSTSITFMPQCDLC
jgi:hypothetical protein